MGGFKRRCAYATASELSEDESGEINWKLVDKVPPLNIQPPNFPTLNYQFIQLPPINIPPIQAHGPVASIMGTAPIIPRQSSSLPTLPPSMRTRYRQ